MMMSEQKQVFVFGSNAAGRHGKGAALHATHHHGAPYGKADGRISEASYAIPTKDRRLQTLNLADIMHFIAKFVEHARTNPDVQFFVTAVGCGLAANREVNHKSIAPLFYPPLPNCEYPPEWRMWLGEKAQYHSGECGCEEGQVTECRT